MGSSPRAGTSDLSLQFGRYRVIEEVSRAAGSVVYKARDPLIDRLVILKTLAVGLPRDEVTDFRKRVDRELKSAGRLNHPNIVTIYDVGVTGDIVYIATEFIDGRSLRDMLGSGARPMPARAAQIAAQILDGLDFVHERGLVHRNISPDTVIVLRNGAVKITDFGIARPSRGPHTQIADLVASPRYTSPEQVTGEKVDERSDIFSLGAVLYELLTGSPPFAAGRLHEVAYQVVNKMPPPPSTCTRGVTPALDLIVEKAMAKQPDNRYRTAREMAVDLRTAANLSPVVGGDAAEVLVPPPPASSKILRPWRRQPLLLYGVFALMLTTVAVALLRSPALPQLPASPPMATGSVPTTIEHQERASATSLAPVAQATSPPVETAPFKQGSVSSKSGAQLTLAIRPWGVVYVNGKKKGLSPPMKELMLPPGQYTVEIRNEKFQPHRESIELRKGIVTRITHSFDDTSNNATNDRAPNPPAASAGTPLLSEQWPR